MSTSDTTPKPRRGFLFYGCLTGTVCLVAILLALLLGLHQFKKMLTWYTDTKPMELPTVQMSSEQYNALQQRLETFQEAVRSRRHTPPLTLTADDINGLIANDPKLRGLKGKLFVTIENSRLKGQISIPLQELGLGAFKGRYLNGVGTFSVSINNGLLTITPDVIVVKGKPLPGVYMDKIRAQNLADKLNEDTRASVALNRFQEIKVQDNQLILVPKEEK